MSGADTFASGSPAGAVVRLETTTRYYLCSVQQDLFGAWEVWRAWGAKGSALGNSMRQPACNAEHARKLFEDVLRLRVRNGYIVVRAASTR